MNSFDEKIVVTFPPKKSTKKNYVSLLKIIQKNLKFIISKFYMIHNKNIEFPKILYLNFHDQKYFYLFLRQ